MTVVTDFMIYNFIMGWLLCMSILIFLGWLVYRQDRRK